MAGSLSVRQKNAEAARQRRIDALKVERRRANEAATANVGKLGSGIASIPGRVVNYIKSSSPSSVARDVKGIARSTYEAATEDPNAFIEDAVFSPLAAIRDFGDVRETARKLRAQGRDAEAEKMEAMAGTAILSAVPILGRPAGAATRKAIKAAEKTAVKGATKKAVKTALKVTPEPRLALPAPPKQLALPAPGPGLPPFAVKTKGGQWFVDKSIGGMRASDLDVKVAQMPDDGRWVVMINKTPMIFAREDEARAKAQSIVDQSNPNRSPENAARRIADNSLRLARDASGPLSQLQDWFLRAAPRYIKNEMGTPDDPMRALAERGGLHIEMSPDEWSDTASSVISRQPIGSYLGLDRLYAPVGSDPRAGNDYAASLAVNMPWLQKAPVTDELYGIGDTYALQEKMGMAHLLDEMRNAMDPRSGLPSDLAVRPESLGRMGLAQAAERVGLINQFRAKEMERAALSNLDSPAVQTFKEYAENNPMGLRWSELKAPDDIPEGYSVRQGDDAPREGWFGVYGPDGQPIVWAPTEDQARRSAAKAPLQQALKYEGDTMGHCVGNYCDDVMEGKSRIFSLRDAKGEPHVTIETRPGRQDRAYSDAIAQLRGTEYWPAWLENQRTRQDNPGSTQDLIDYMNQFRRSQGLEPIEAETTQDIVQIKGKQNAAPKDTYLPFVQDFVKSGQWGNIGDLANTGLVKLPDGRYITAQQAEEAITAIPERVGNAVYDPTYLHAMDPEVWQAVSRYFEGYAIGGRVSADRCFCRHPMSVKR